MVEDIASLRKKPGPVTPEEEGETQDVRPASSQVQEEPASAPVAALADEIGVDVADVESAFAPSQDPPYVRVEKYYWNAFKNNTPGGGPTAISSGALVGTLMSLWFDQLDRDPPTKDEIVDATAAAKIEDKNIDRSIKNCDWLRADGSQVTVSPAQLDKAVRVAKAFCLKEEIEEE